MKLTITLLTICLASLSFTVSGQTVPPGKTQFPLFEEVYTYVSSLIDRPCEDCQFGLAKKTDGYFVTVTPYPYTEGPKEMKLIKVWDAATKNYLSFDVSKYTDQSATPVYTDALSTIRWKQPHFDRSYCIGYPEADADLIKMLADKPDITLPELEMLGRAYSEMASDYIHPNQYGNNIPETKDLSDPMFESIPKERIARFIDLADKSLACFYQIRNSNPQYEVIILTDLEMKIQHDLMHYYHYLSSVKEDKLAKKYLDLANYNESEIRYAKALLDNCSQNGILLTEGDTDTYPLWYMQEKMGYRKDVSVINHSLLQTPWSFAMLKELKIAEFDLSLEEYKVLYVNYAILEDSLPVTDWNTWLKPIRKQLPALKTISPYSSERISLFPSTSRRFQLEIRGEEATVTFEESYLAGPDIALMDLFQTNSGRSIYFSSPVALIPFDLLSHCAPRGMAYELTPAKNNELWDSLSIIRFEHAVRESTIPPLSGFRTTDKYVFNNWTYTWTQMPYAILNENMELLNYFIQRFPPQDVLATNDPEIIGNYSNVLALADAKQLSTYLDSYSKHARELLASIRNKKHSFKEQDVEQLIELYELYSRSSVRGRTYSDFTNSRKQKKVLSALRKVVAEFLSEENKARLSWSYERLELLENAFRNFE